MTSADIIPEIFAEIFAESALGEVDHVDVVAHARAVVGWVVIAKHVEPRPLTHRDLKRDRAEIARRLQVSSARISRRFISAFISANYACCMYGIRLFGIPFGSSPILPDGCAPTGLK